MVDLEGYLWIGLAERIVGQFREMDQGVETPQVVYGNAGACRDSIFRPRGRWPEMRVSTRIYVPHGYHRVPVDHQSV